MGKPSKKDSRKRSHARKDPKAAAVAAFASNPFNKHTKPRQLSAALQARQGNPSNAFLDRRLGENVDTMTMEEKLFARFQRQQARHAARKKRKYNLEDGDDVYTQTLTHKGRALDEADALKDRPDDDSDDGGVFDASYVSRAHFGGGDGPAGPRTHKEIMEVSPSFDAWASACLPVCLSACISFSFSLFVCFLCGKPSRDDPAVAHGCVLPRAPTLPGSDC